MLTYKSPEEKKLNTKTTFTQTFPQNVKNNNNKKQHKYEIHHKMRHTSSSKF